jgi:hypothetical protein
LVWEAIKKLLSLEDIKLPLSFLGLPLSLWQFYEFSKIENPKKIENSFKR